jgi:hypothetical protein
MFIEFLKAGDFSAMKFDYFLSALNVPRHQLAKHGECQFAFADVFDCACNGLQILRAG